ncbi:PorT family protein [Mucilaginibacter corticis]|uniref:PorT family protein n=1 Tax=Mucilaginibacter corticis TaxID=2597670 RepID=A0A556MLB0_9SPHI|nr:porin family protein [Mucilaginibacter corticis]TSJ40632.1 PorT family protein [Mucilaginibacter corticis]
MVKKAIVVLAVVCISTLSVHAQKIIFGAKIAGGFAYQQYTNADVISTGSIKTFNIKGIAQIPLKNDFWLEAGLGISNKGSIIYNDALTTTTHLTYLEVPVSILRKFTFTSLGIFYLGAGGYVADGLGGEFDYQTPGSTASDKVNFGKNNDILRFDTGLNFSTGFEFRNRVTFNMAYTLGLNNIASSTQQDAGTSVVKNKEFSIGLGYLFK